MKKACLKVTDSYGVSSFEALSAIQRRMPKKIVESAIISSVLKFSEMKSLNRNPVINIGKDPSNNLFKKESLEDNL